MGFVWFWIVAVMIAAYVVLDGFDLGVGILSPFLGRSEDDRRTLFRSIGPVWDGNQVENGNRKRHAALDEAATAKGAREPEAGSQ